MKLRVLLGVHRPGDSAEATLVLAAAAGLSGFMADGSRMQNGQEKKPRLRELAAELKLPLSAIRRGVRELVQADAIAVEQGIIVKPEALAARWSAERQRIRITTDARQLGMRPRPLLLTALVTGQATNGTLRLGIGFLMERTGFTRRTTERVLATARSCGAIHTWKRPPDWQLHLAVGPSRGNETAAVEAAAADPGSPASQGMGHEVAVPPVTEWRTPRLKVAETPSRSGARDPDDPDRQTDSPPEPSSTAGETEYPSSRGRQRPHEGSRAPAIPDIVDGWVRSLAERWCFSAQDDADVSAVATLLERISPSPAVIHDRAAFVRNRLELAKDIICWCPDPERLGRWIVRVWRWFRVDNLGAYLRGASRRGNPGTLLESHSKNVLGRASEKWHDFTPATERALRGPRAADIEAITASLTVATHVVDDEERAHLREQLKRFWQQERPVAARRVLLRLVGDTHSDVTLQKSVDGILSLADAKRLLGVA